MKFVASFIRTKMCVLLCVSFLFPLRFNGESSTHINMKLIVCISVSAIWLRDVKPLVDSDDWISPAESTPVGTNDCILSLSPWLLLTLNAVIVLSHRPHGDVISVMESPRTLTLTEAIRLDEIVVIAVGVVSCALAGKQNNSLMDTRKPHQQRR